jgi:hypothetical protein
MAAANSEYWFWDLGRDVLTKQEALQSVKIGDTLDGDELIVHPSNPERVFVLPPGTGMRFMLRGTGFRKR